MSLHYILAYVNPGSGLLLLQLLMAGAVGFIFVFRRSLARILRFGRQRKPDAPATDATPRQPAPADPAMTAVPAPTKTKS